jgi:hypothetical protein
MDTKFSVVQGDALQIEADCLVLKYAQATFGLDQAIEQAFEKMGESITTRLPAINQYFYTKNKAITHTKGVLFIGTPPLRDFGYEEIRDFGRNTITAIIQSDPAIQKVLMTVHGVGYGLDEAKAFQSQLEGITDGLFAFTNKHRVTEIIFVEQLPDRAKRLHEMLLGMLRLN